MVCASTDEIFVLNFSRTNTNWLVVWNIWIIFPYYMGCHRSHWLSYFSRWLKTTNQHIICSYIYIYIISNNGSILPANNYLLVSYVCHCCPAEGSTSGITFPWRIHGAPYIAAPLGSYGIISPLGVVGFIPPYMEFVHARTCEDTTLSTL